MVVGALGCRAAGGRAIRATQWAATDVPQRTTECPRRTKTSANARLEPHLVHLDLLPLPLKEAVHGVVLAHREEHLDGIPRDREVERLPDEGDRVAVHAHVHGRQLLDDPPRLPTGADDAGLNL